MSQSKNKRYSTLQQIKREEYYYRDYPIISRCQGNLKKYMQLKPLAEVHMEVLGKDLGNLYTESRVREI
jgi:hypothetical protein